MTFEPVEATAQSEKQQRFLALLAPVRQRLSSFAMAMTRNREDAEDLAGETILVAFENLEKLRDQVTFTSWIFTIATRIHNRRRRRLKFFGRYDQDHAERIHSTVTQPDVSAEIRMLYDALARLPEKQRESVILFEISDLSLDEVRAIQGGSLSGVKSRITRGREKLSEILGVKSEITTTPRADDATASKASESRPYLQLFVGVDQ